MKVFVGDDWAEAHHDVHLMNGNGDKLATKRHYKPNAMVDQYFTNRRHMIVVELRRHRSPSGIPADAADPESHHRATPPTQPGHHRVRHARRPQASGQTPPSPTWPAASAASADVFPTRTPTVWVGPHQSDWRTPVRSDVAI